MRLSLDLGLGSVATLNAGVGVTPAQRETLQRLKAAAAAAYQNNPVYLPDLSSPPTITTSSTHDAAYSVQKFPAVDPASFAISPGKRWRFVSSNNRLSVTHNSVAPSTSGSLKANFAAATLDPTLPADGYDNVNCFSVGCVFSGTSIEIEMRALVGGTDNPYRIIADGQYVARDGFLVDAANKTFEKLTFGSAGPHSIVVEAQRPHLVGGFSVPVGQTISAPAPAPVAGIVGDSFAEAIQIGSAVFRQWDGLGWVFAKMAGLNMGNHALGGTGYWNQNGGVPGTRSNIVTQMDYWLSTAAFDLIVVAGGYNDAGQVADANIRTLARQSWEKARLAHPNALITVMGVWGGATVTSDAAVRCVTEAALKAEFDAWRDPCSMFIPVSPNYTDAWVNGAGYEGSPTGVGNSDLYTSTDGTHPNRAGHIYLGGRMDTAYRAKLALLPG